MSFRARLLLGFVAVVLGPLVVFGLGIRRGIASRLTAQYEGRVAALTDVIRGDLERQSADIAGRLRALRDAAVADNQLRVAILQGGVGERPYRLDYTGKAMRLAGFSMLQIQDGDGRILSSGHFRNEYDRLEPELPRLLAAAPKGMALVRARTAEAPFLTLARVDSFRVGGRPFTLVGGVTVDSAFLAHLAPDSNLVVSLDTVARADTAGSVVDSLIVPAVATDSARLVAARIVVAHSLAGLDALRHEVDRWFVVTLAVAGAIALLLAGWLSARISRPLTALAERTARIDMDRLDVEFSSDRRDEIGALTRLLGAMTERLRAGAARLREAERRIALGDLARQVNHDIKNGLIPIRNVFRHLAQVAREQPERLGPVFADRQGTVESSVTYLEGLAGNYARLYPEPAPAGGGGACDVNALVTELASRLGTSDPAVVRLELADALPAVHTDPLVLRRTLENLVGNALDALEGRPGTVTVSTARVAADGRPGIRIAVADTGKGMTKQQLDKAFEGFYTTKPGGTGLGLSIVRRLVLDAGGSLRVETEPGTGTRVYVELPCEAPYGRRA